MVVEREVTVLQALTRAGERAGCSQERMAINRTVAKTLQGSAVYKTLQGATEVFSHWVN